MTSPPWSDVEVVLFDWNGTLVDDVERASTALEVVLAQRRLPPLGLAEFRQTFHLPLSRWLSELGFANDDLVSAEADWNREMRSRPVTLQPGARDILSRLNEAGRTIGVVSAASTESVKSDIGESGLDELIRLVVGKSEDKVQTLRDIMDGQAPAGVYVGDVEYDIMAGREAGLLVVGFTGGYRPAEALQEMNPDALIDHLAELGSLLGLAD